MAKRKHFLYPKALKQMTALGLRLRDARLRRRFSMETVCERAGISRTTLYKIEQGDPSVALGHYVEVLRVLLLLEDLALIAFADPIGRRIQDDELPRRAPRADKKRGTPSRLQGQIRMADDFNKAPDDVVADFEGED